MTALVRLAGDGYPAGMRTAWFLLALPLLVGCPPGMDDDDAVSGECPPEDRFTSDPAACTENFCGLPTVQAATGNSAESFRVLTDGDTIPIWYGEQGGYHIDLAFGSTNLCPVVFVDFELYDVTGGADTLIHSSRRHVQAVRTPDADPPSTQRWWPEQFRFPCAYWPNDPEHDPSCNDAPIAFLDELDLELRVATEDHNENRSASTTVAVDATCCN